MRKKSILMICVIAIAGITGVLLYPTVFREKKERKILYWSDPMMPGFKSEKPGKSPMGMEMVPVYDSTDNSGTTAQSPGENQDQIEYYTCPMHPQVRADHPGNCSICSMKLVPVMKQPVRGGTVTPGPRQDGGKIFVPSEKQQLIGLKTTTAEVRSLAATIRTVGKVDYAEPKLAVVTLRTGAWIENLFVDYVGKEVRKGDPLFTVYSPDLVSAQQEYLIAKKAANDTNWSVESDSTTQSNLLQTARQRLRLWQFTDEQIRKLEERDEPETYVPIRSPISGYVIEKKALAGMKIEPGMELYKIADLSTVWVLADVYEYELPFVKVGQSAEIDFPYSTLKEPLRGTIIYIYPFLDPMTRVQRVRLEFLNPNNALKPDMFVNVYLKTNLGRKLSLPRDAVLNTGTEQYVFVDEGDGYFSPRIVKVGGETDQFYVISGGLESGERVVTAANFILDSESRLKGVFDQMRKPTVRQEDPQ